MKLIDSVLIALCLAFFCIGISEVINSDADSVSASIVQNYWIFMLSFVFLGGLRYVRMKRKTKEGHKQD